MVSAESPARSVRRRVDRMDRSHRATGPNRARDFWYRLPFMVSVVERLDGRAPLEQTAFGRPEAVAPNRDHHPQGHRHASRTNAFATDAEVLPRRTPSTSWARTRCDADSTRPGISSRRTSNPPPPDGSHHLPLARSVDSFASHTPPPPPRSQRIERNERISAHDHRSRRNRKFSNEIRRLDGHCRLQCNEYDSAATNPPNSHSLQGTRHRPSLRNARTSDAFSDGHHQFWPDRPPSPLRQTTQRSTRACWRQLASTMASRSPRPTAASGPHMTRHDLFLRVNRRHFDA